MATAYIKIRKDKCKGCKLCMAACAQALIDSSDGEMNDLGYTPMKFADSEAKCKGCKMCAEMCPDMCIEVFKISGGSGK